MILDFKKHKELIKQYLSLRNKYSSVLLTDKVNAAGTVEWLNNKDVEVFIDIKDGKLTGVCILHTYRKGEITIFVDKKNKKIGTKLIKKIENTAKERDLLKIWAWTSTENSIANIFFIKNGYSATRFKEKDYKNKKIRGIIYEKTLK